MTIRTDQMMMQLLQALCETWEEHASPENIRLNEKMVALLDNVHDELLHKEVLVPAVVKDYYRRVFVKEMWNARGRN